MPTIIALKAADSANASKPILQYSQTDTTRHHSLSTDNLNEIARRYTVGLACEAFHLRNLQKGKPHRAQKQ
jgi:hypothetical protein